MAAHPSLRRRRRRWGAGLTGLAVASLTAASATDAGWASRAGDPPSLHAQAVAVNEDGQRVPLRHAELDRLVDDTRALDAATAQAQRDWLAAGALPGAGGPWADLGRDALLDLRVLLLDDGAAVAGWTPHWRYVWPRDAAFAAVALARTGHTEDAESILAFLQRVRPRGDAGFQARYLPDGSGVPDDRGVEADGAGWVLWAIGELTAVTAPADRAALLHRLDPLLLDATAIALAELRRGGGLPRPGLDYWEIDDRRVSLGLAAPLLVGLQAAAAPLTAAGHRDLAGRTGRAAATLSDRIDDVFGAAGYPRYAPGSPGGTRPVRDASLTFLMSPFREPEPDELASLLPAWRAAQIQLLRPAGGLAPGAGWRRDGISWTPETALFALTAAAAGDREAARGWLTWLDEHRTEAGALPEKVLGDGSPASVAPLAWTAALVVLTLTESEQAARPTVSGYSVTAMNTGVEGGERGMSSGDSPGVSHLALPPTLLRSPARVSRG